MPLIRNPTHTLYLDDSGQKEYPPEGVAFSAGLSRYFVFGGFLIRVKAAGQLARGLSAAKVKHFKTDQVEVKSNWLRMPEERERRYLKPFGLSADQLSAFVNDFYAEGLAAELVLLACVVDKQHMTDEYGENRWYPPAVAYEALVQRGQLELGAIPPCCFSTIVDDMTGKTPKAHEYRENLQRHHEQLKQSGSRLLNMRLPCLTGRIKLVNSRDSSLIQLADLVAYNVFRQFRDHGEDWENTGLPQLPTYDWFRRIACKFCKGSDGRIQGFGVVKFPMLKRVRWREQAGRVIR